MQRLSSRFCGKGKFTPGCLGVGPRVSAGVSGARSGCQASGLPASTLELPPPALPPDPEAPPLLLLPPLLLPPLLLAELLCPPLEPPEEAALD